MRQREIIKVLHDYKQEQAKQYGILAIGVFGSVARDEAADDSDEDVSSPSWHADVLKAREARIAAGTSRFLEVADAKQAVRDRLN